MTRNELIAAVYATYTPTTDYLVINDRLRWLEKQTDEKLLEILNKKK